MPEKDYKFGSTKHQKSIGGPGGGPGGPGGGFSGEKAKNGKNL